MAKKKNEISIRSSAAEYLTYIASVGEQEDSIEMRYEDENIWLTQKMMATLYDVDVRTISDHIKKVYSDSELEETATIRKFRIVQTEGPRQVQREVNHYNLQMIIAVGFKVNNERAAQFRKWANGIAAIGQGHNVFSNTLILAVFPELYAIVALAATFLIGSALVA